jgi:hypothetical protein
MATSFSFPEVRISKALGEHGYGAVRISVIDGPNNTRAAYDKFSYDQGFRYRWRTHRLRTMLQKGLPSGATDVDIDGSRVTIRLPAEGDGVRGILFGDPCTEPGFVGCIHVNMSQRLPRLVNSLADVDFRAIIGDAFYDLDGSVTSRFYSRLTPRAKEVVQLAVPGNHDFWYKGDPLLGQADDQRGNGFMQWYGQDTLGASTSGDSPYNFDSDPDATGSPLANWSNFFFYHTIGNVGFIGFSNAHGFEEQPFRRACSFFGKSPTPPAAIYLLGHWNIPLFGCGVGETTPAVYARVRELPGCDAPGRLTYAMGHVHCNRVAADRHGFLLGGTGVRGGPPLGCNVFGFAYVDTTGHRELGAHFGLSSPSSDRYQEILECFERRGIGACLDFADVWRNASLGVTLSGRVHEAEESSGHREG